jgi:hypothetical protein
MEIVRIGDSASEPLPTGDRPLSGIRVLDLTRVLAGPTCARTLAEHGADVMKITSAHLPSLGYQECDTGHGKLSAELDLRTPADVDILRGQVRKADVFAQGYRPGTLANRGLSPEELAAVRPGLVYVSLCAFGHTGPWASRRGFDTVVQTVSGMTIRQAESIPGKTPEPQFYPVSAIDYCTGYLMAFGAMVALARRAREGGSWLVRISLAQVGKWIVDLGEVPAAALKNIPAEFTPSELERWSTVTETARPPQASRAVVGKPRRTGRGPQFHLVITAPCGRDSYARTWRRDRHPPLEHQERRQGRSRRLSAARRCGRMGRPASWRPRPCVYPGRDYPTAADTVRRTKGLAIGSGRHPVPCPRDEAQE